MSNDKLIFDILASLEPLTEVKGLSWDDAEKRLRDMFEEHQNPADDGGQAFPQTLTVDIDGREHIAYPGMTVRDYFAGQAVQAAVTGHFGHYGHHNYWAPKDMASYAYEVADAMIAARMGGAA